MKARFITTAVIAATILVGTAGCNMVAPQATLKHYDASDGVSANVGSLAIRNALVISEGEKSGVLAMTVVNDSSETQSLSVEFPGGKTVVEIAGSSSTVFGLGSEKGIPLSGFTTLPGADARTIFQYGTETAAEVRVPVLEPLLEEYQTLTPAPSSPATTIPATDEPSPAPSTSN